jgi:hypothetical protein
MEKEPGLLTQRLEFEKEVRTWAKLTKKQLATKLRGLDLRAKSRLRKKPQIGFRTSRQFGDLSAVSFSFPRRAIFLEHGVGKGRPKGSASASKNAKPWLAPVMDKAEKEFNTTVVDKYADDIVTELKVLIPGVIDFTTRKKNNGK